MIINIIYRYLCQHSHFWYLHHFLQNNFIGLQNVLLPWFEISYCFGGFLESLYIFGDHDYKTWFIVTYVSILTSDISSIFYKTKSMIYRTFCYPDFSNENQLLFRWISLVPIHFRRPISRPVSCYAFLKGWLLPSLPPGCLPDKTSLLTKKSLKDLNK